MLGAAPRRAVQRLTSDPGDIIILLGGRTGRDGIGGATGSSKAHNTQSTAVCGAEVQKGNPPTERKIQRLFRREEVAHMIKKCNDFGAGGVSVAIGELADGLRVDLDKVPKKYAGLDGTEIAISESQERMAVVVDPKDVDTFMGYAKEENLEATCVAKVTEDARLVLSWRGDRFTPSGPDLEREGDRESLPCVPRYQRSAPGDRGCRGYPEQKRQYPCKGRDLRCKREVDEYLKGSECVLSEGACGDVRRFHRSGFCIHASRGTVSDDGDAGYGCQASGNDG